MGEDYLRQTANQLLQPPAAAADEFETHRESLAEEHNRRLAQRPDLDKLIGPGNLAMMQDNSRNFCRFMSTMFRGYHPEVLVQTVLWVFRAYRAHGFTTLFWPAHLDTFVQLAQERLNPATFAALEPHFRWLIAHIPVFVTISDEPLAAAWPKPLAHSALPPEQG